MIILISVKQGSLGALYNDKGDNFFKEDMTIPDVNALTKECQNTWSKNRKTARISR